MDPSESRLTPTQGAKLTSQNQREITASGQRLRIDPADDLLTALVCRSLSATGRRSLTQLKVTTSSGCVRLEGTVPSYFVKQLAAQAIMSLPGLERLDDRLTVD
ncbi:BON domain-containing protein [Planctomicrobium piriforme]|uniref:BON domain-containing protein n=1 Tax=Planctomicrobium piriforme TaxID=1576369 RepID=A0A1I3PGA8_9PLAN|nr:BON domain-containing protein [Planctomicrobium piriforme]SFJ20461.1 BON domain-containing protein [Planctomicrobium piriforme]